MACTGNCNQGRACTCSRPVMPFGGCACSLGLSCCNCASTPARPAPARPASVIRTRPTPMARLRRWWHLLRLRQQLAGLDQEHETVFREISDLQAARFLPDEPAAKALADATISMRKLELLDITQRRVEVAKRIEQAEVVS